MGTPWGLTTEQRFWMKVQKTPTCWLWTASKTTNGYGMFGNRKDVSTAHRWAYKLMVGPIPDGYQIDHLCHVRACVNPAHLEAVTPLENARRAHARRVLRPCGTYAALVRHKNRGEEPCDSCVQAGRAYYRARESRREKRSA